MNALISYRANGLGNLTVTRKQEQEAMKEITSTYRAKVLGILKASGAISKSATTATGATTSTGNTTSAATGTGSNQELGRDAFLQLLVTQLQGQDPLQPVDNSQMLAQLAQFSSLEQMQNLNSSFDFLSGNIDQLNFISAQGLLGKYVEGINQSGNMTAGTVDSVNLNGSIVVLNIGGDTVNMSDVLGIADKAPSTTAGKAQPTGTSGK